MTTLREKVGSFRRGFTDIFDDHGKFKKHYVENLEGLACKQADEINDLKAEIIRLKTPVNCDLCKNKKDGLYLMICFGCKHYHPDCYEAKI